MEEAVTNDNDKERQNQPQTGPGDDTDCGQLMQRVKSEGVKAPAKPAAPPSKDLKKLEKSDQTK